MLSADAQVLPQNDLITLVQGAIAKKYGTHSDQEDLIQEASFFAWKKHEAGGTDLECYFAGRDRARSMVYSLKTGTGDAFTGKPVNRNEYRVQANGEAVREKIRMYIGEYTKLHGHEPNNSEISRGVGTSHNNVRHHKKHLHLFSKTTSMNPHTLSLDAAHDASQDNGSASSWLSNLPSLPPDDDSVAARVDVGRALATLSQKDRDFLYLEFWEDQTYASIGKQLGYKPNYVNKLRKRILARVEKALGATV